VFDPVAAAELDKRAVGRPDAAEDLGDDPVFVALGEHLVSRRLEALVARIARPQIVDLALHEGHERGVLPDAGQTNHALERTQHPSSEPSKPALTERKKRRTDSSQPFWASLSPAFACEAVRCGAAAKGVFERLW